MKNPTTLTSLSRRDLLKRGSAVALGAAVGSQAITGFPTIWAQNIKNVTLRQFGTGVSNINEIAKKAKEEKKVEGVASIEEIKGAVDDLNDRLAKQEVAVSFTVDDKTNRVVVQITDSDSGKMIRQIPSEETLKFARNVEKGVGLLVDSKL